MDRVRADSPAPHVQRLMINRPEARNALDRETRLQLVGAVQNALEDTDTRALLLCGAEGVFCAGGDLASMRNLTASQAHKRMESGHELVRLLWNADIPVLAAVEKYAIGAGAGLALLCDYIVAGESALMSFPFLQFGLVPDWGSTQMLIRRTGWGNARRLILEKASVKGRQLAEAGIADRVVGDAEVLSAATETAAEFARYPQQAVTLLKSELRAYPAGFEDMLNMEKRDQVSCFLSREFDEGLNAYLEKRAADFLNLDSKQDESGKKE